MSDWKKRNLDFSVPSKSSKFELHSHFEKPEIECENEMIAFKSSNEVRDSIMEGL